jgi:uncharacterized protein (DUF433 family)
VTAPGPAAPADPDELHRLLDRRRATARTGPGLRRFPAPGPGTYHEGVDFERITIDPAQMRGVPCIRGLRIPVAAVLGQLAAGRTPAEILADFPDLEPDDLTAALEYAAAAVQERELPLTRPA